MERYTKLNRFDNTILAGDLADNYSAWPAWRPARGIRALGVPHPSVVFVNRMFTRLRIWLKKALNNQRRRRQRTQRIRNILQRGY